MALIHQPVLWFFGTGHVQIGLVNVVVLCAYVELVGFLFWKFHSVDSDQSLLVVLSVG